MITRSIWEFVDTSTVSVMMSILSGNDLSVVSGIIVDGSFSGTRQGSDFSSLVESNLILVRENRRIEGQDSHKEDSD